ncbi:apolipoprotein N-acyltransferase [Methylonatrum kenyense]|uniref:apolipoprotein N-acyltransferase n=1 Tax=Methylonatrum kenyense TaxID=455253 RepID=UPI0020BF0FBC|nr:apolipoprotein N-acyltransferase [Methylonatrum kenyense]MCK8516236.1 apolipoprotein N-acyltransferase [Methylonatrum kenyense]
MQIPAPALTQRRWIYLLAAVAGGLSPLIYAPFGWSLLALLIPAALFALVLQLPRRLAFEAAYVHGVAYYAAGGHWIWYSVGEFGGGPLVATVFCVLLALGFGLLTLAAVALAWVLRPGQRLPMLLLTLPAAWVMLEWVQGWLFTGTTWLQLGYSQTDGWFGAYAPLIGPLGISLLLAVLAGGLVAAVLAGRVRGMVLAVGAALAFWVGGAVIDRDWTEPAGEPLQVALLQGNIAQDEKWEPDNRVRTLELYRRLNDRYLGADLIVWPETAVPAFYHHVVDSYLVPLAEEAAEHGTELLIGIPSYDADSRRIFNSVLGLGEEIGFYHKRHLVPFGEYVPFRGLFGGALDVFGAPMSDFSAGWRAEPLSVAGQRAAVSICYEITFPNEVRDFLPEATLLVNVSNDGWFGTSIGPHQHFQISRMRARETGRPLLRSTNTGITAAVDHRGRVVARAPQFSVEALAAEITPMQGSTLYTRTGDLPVLLTLAGMLLLSGGLRWWHRRRPVADADGAGSG